VRINKICIEAGGVFRFIQSYYKFGSGEPKTGHSPPNEMSQVPKRGEVHIPGPADRVPKQSRLWAATFSVVECPNGSPFTSCPPRLLL